MIFKDPWHQKLQGLSCGVICAMLLAILTQYWHVTDRWTHDNSICLH